MKPPSLAEIAAALGAEAAGDLQRRPARLAEPAAAGPEDLALALSPAYAEGLAQGRAQAAVLWPGADWQGLGLKAAIFAPRGRLAMAGLTRAFDSPQDWGMGVHPTAIIDPSATLGAGSLLGAFSLIGAGTQIGPGARIGPQVMIGEGVEIGQGALIHPGVKIGRGVKIGARVILQPGAVIGADGFSFVTPERSGVEEIRQTLGQRETHKAQSWIRIHSLGAVRLGDDVEVGANCTIDRGTIRDTEIGAGTKLDNLVHIGHNVQVGRDCLLCGQVGIAGSSKIGDRVVLGGQCGVNDNIFIGDDVIAGGASKIFTNVPAGRVILGYPAVKMDSHIEMQKALRRLPRLSAAFAALQKRLGGTGGGEEL